MSVTEKIEKIGEKVTEGYKEIETDVVDGYKAVENIAVESYKAVEKTFVDGFTKMSDDFIEKHLLKDGETLEDAKERLAKEQEERTNAHKVDIEAMQAKQKERIEKSIEASKNAGKR